MDKLRRGEGREGASTLPSEPNTVAWAHVSDFHFKAKTDYGRDEVMQALLRDLAMVSGQREAKHGVEPVALDFVVVTGDVAYSGQPEQYQVARRFFGELSKATRVPPERTFVVPGNHDVSWDLSKAAYQFYRRPDYRGTLGPGTFIEHGTQAIEVRDEDSYGLRFQPFADLFKVITGTPYSLAAVDQVTLDTLDDGKLLIMGLNSAWEIDHHFHDRASIHTEALATALLKLGPPSAEQLRIAVFHHPINSAEESRIKDSAFLQQLAVAGFRVALHGHVHRADAAQYRYDRKPGGRQIEIVAAGTFGAPTREWVPGYPLQYNLLLIGADKVTVETRKREEVGGAWSPDARWLQGPGQDPLPRYVIER